MSSKVEHVFFVDINETIRNFVEYRAKKLGVEKKLTFCKTIQDTQISKFDTIVCLDVLEHLADPASQIEIFNEFIDNAFNLKSHLMEFLSIKECDLDEFLTNAKMNLANSHPGDALNDVSDFYTEIVGDRHVADLAAWHLTSLSLIHI